MIFVSINRYERKKAIDLALGAFEVLKRTLPERRFRQMHLVIVGGYDTRVAENTEHYDELVSAARKAGLLGDSVLPDASLVMPGFPASDKTRAQLGYDQVQSGASVTFIRSCTDAQKAFLLRAASAILYTPSNEHFGIVPLEAMAAFRPVIAVASGGPLESIVHQSTGFLCEPSADSFANAIARIASNPSLVTTMGRAGHEHVAARFSRQAFANRLEELCEELVASAGRSRR